jgi:sugar O-acyltransferase (sialic acid O-acetyltransferase NeuD family)
MEIEKLIILGKSDSTITMILDNLESNNQFPEIEILNNLNEPIKQKIDNLNFNISFVSDLYNIDNIFLGVYKPKVKFALFEQYKKYSDFFTNIIHKSSQISTTTNLGYGCLINSLVSIAAHSNIGNFVTINRNSTIGHHTIIGDYVSINPGVNVAGNVIIGNNTLIGMGTNIIDGIKIGKNSIIGAGSLVTKDIPDNVIAYGNPCKIIRENETQSL